MLFNFDWSASSIAAYIGALAWLPQIFWWISKKIVKPIMSVYPDDKIKIGYMFLGPIINLRLALISEEKDALINCCQVEILHENGEKRLFAWKQMAWQTVQQKQSITENKFETTNNLLFTPIIIKIIQ